MRGLAVVLVVGLVAAACSSGGDQPATPPASLDGAAATTGPGGTTANPSSTAPATAAPSTTAAPGTTPSTAPSSTAPSTTAAPTTAAPTSAPPTTTAPTSVPDTVRPTIDELISSGEVLNIAHAGGDQEWPHSTFFAYDNAVAAGADVLEMDVQLTGDGVLIVQHDDTVDKTTGATGRVDSFTFAEIAELDAGYWFAEGCWPCHDLPDDDYIYRGVRTGDIPPPAGADPDDFRIVRFAEMAERYPDQAFDIEIKGEGEAGLATAEALAAEIDEHDLTDSVVVVSFDDALVERFHELAPDVEVSPGQGTLIDWLLVGEPLDEIYRIVQVPPESGGIAVITPEFWDRVAEAGVAVWMWPNDAATQENAEFYQEMIDQGVTGIIAGRPSQVP